MKLSQAPANETELDRLASDMSEASLAERLALVEKADLGRTVFTTSFGLEDQVITDAMLTAGSTIEIVSLDTGRLFPETTDLWAETEARYGRRIPALVPEAPALEALIAENGINGFRRSVAARLSCCGVRKVEPLARALAGAAVWITGLRAEQSAGRTDTPLVAFDRARGVVKVSPLADWDRGALAEYALLHRVPTHPLHERGYPSIGCAPCTRAVRPGEPERAGRWWWEDEARKECGLHLPPPSPLAPRPDATSARHNPGPTR